MAAAVLSLMLAAGLSYFLFRGPGEPVRTVRSSIAPPAGASFWLDAATPGPPAVAPDGRRIAFSARGPDGKIRLYVRSLDAAEPVVLPGTEDAQYPFWSPDSRTIGFFTESKLKAVEADGGPPVTVCSTETDPKGGTLREICNTEAYRTLEVPDGVGGRFSVLSAVGLFSAGMCGIDIDALMAGAAAMDKRLKDERAPLILATVEATVPLWREVSDYKYLVDDFVNGNPDHSSGVSLPSIGQQAS